MGVRRLAAISVIIIFALVSCSYLINKYNPNTVEFYFKENISRNDYEKIRESNRDVIFSMNYIMRYQGNKLTMTTGFDYLMKEMKLSEGSFLADMNMREAVIGDMTAEKYFKSSNVIGQLINIFGTEYKVEGIINGSNEIYVPYSDKLSSLSWQKRIIRCSISDKKYFYLKLESIQGQLDTFGVEILDVVVYREEMSTYRNIAILAALYTLVCCFLMLIRRIRGGLTSLRKEYLENSRVIELHAHLLKEGRKISVVMCYFPIGLTILYVIIKLLSNLCIPPSMIPDNLFSPASYISVVRLLYEKYFARLENGIDGILEDVKILNAVFVMIALSIAAITSKIYPLWKKHKAMFLAFKDKAVL